MSRFPVVTRSPSGSWPGLWVQWCHEVADDGGGNSLGLWEPAQERIPRPSGHIHQAIDLRDYLSFQLPDRPEHAPVPLDLLLVSPFIGLGDPEMNGHDHALMRPSPRTHGRPGFRRALGVDNAVADSGEASAQRVAEEHFMPVPIPHDASGPTALL